MIYRTAIEGLEIMGICTITLAIAPLAGLDDTVAIIVDFAIDVAWGLVDFVTK